MIMRPIKFRGKTLSGEWAYGSLIKLDIGYIILTNEVAETSDESDERDVVMFSADEIAAVVPQTVGQFTGMLDKNGIKIYEGDVLQITDEDINESWKSEVEPKGIVGVYGYDFDYTLIEWADDNLTFEVIGNIYDNL